MARPTYHACFPSSACSRVCQNADFSFASPNRAFTSAAAFSRQFVGELPVLAVIQLPKIALASWLRTHAVMETITFLGFSRGSFSLDFILARPYALAIAYLIPMIVIGIVGLRRFRCGWERRSFLTLVFLVAAAVDYTFTLVFADGRSLTIY